MERSLIKIDKIIRSKRKTISLQIAANGELIVRAPTKINIDYLQKLVLKKSNWILKKRQNILRNQDNFSQKKFTDGEKFLYLGNYYFLNFVDEKKNIFCNDEGFFIENSLSSKAQEIIINFYKEKAREIIFAKVDFFAKKYGFKYAKIKISNAKTRYGSCSSRNVLNFSWRLIMAPISVIEYVVVHEIAHIKHKNHSPKFWNCVAQIFPNYQNQRKWLKDNGRLLMT